MNKNDKHYKRACEIYAESDKLSDGVENMSTFDEWYKNRETTYVFSSVADVTLARKAFNAGMERAAEIVNSANIMTCTETVLHSQFYADEIRKEIDK